MSWVAAAIIGGAAINYIGSQGQANAATSAANTQANAAQAGQQQLQQNFQTLAPNYSPYLQTGQTGLANLNAAMPSLTAQQPAYKPFTAQDLNANLAPNYQFMLQQGLGAQNQALNASGGGSNIGIAGTKFAEDYASNAYQNALQNYMGQQNQAFNQSQTQQTNIYNKLAGIAGIGQNAVSGLSNLATGNATNIANLGIGSANAVAQGQVGSAAANAQGLSGIGSSLTLASLLNPANQSGANSVTPTNMAGFQTPYQAPSYQVTAPQPYNPTY